MSEIHAPKPAPKPAPMFESNASPILDEVRATYEIRGREYSDTWADSRWLALISTLKQVLPDREFTLRELRAIAAGVLVDVKIARLGGEFKADTTIDLIAYSANWLGAMRTLRGDDLV